MTQAQVRADGLRAARIEVDKAYPWPIVDDVEARTRALSAFPWIKE